MKRTNVRLLTPVTPVRSANAPVLVSSGTPPRSITANNTLSELASIVYMKHIITMLREALRGERQGEE
jgi:hypothetical protein